MVDHRGDSDRMVIDDDHRVTTKGRGFGSSDDSGSGRRDDAKMEVDAQADGTRPQRSIEGWILIVRNVHPEADEEALTERFAEYGTIKNLHLNLDRRTGFVKGYALIEYETLKEAQAAISDANGSKFYDQTLKVDFAFVQPKEDSHRRRYNDRRPSNRDRSQSPGR